MKPTDTNKPHLIITIGIPCSGKSFFAERFAETFKAPLVSFDKIQKQLKSKDNNISEISVRSFARYMLDEVLKTGRTVIYEGGINSLSERQSIARIAKKEGYEPIFIWVQTDPTEARKRAIKSKKYASADQFNIDLNKFNSPQKAEDVIVISGKHTYTSQLKIVLKYLIGTPADKKTTKLADKRRFIIRK